MTQVPPITINNTINATPVVIAGVDDGTGNITRGLTLEAGSITVNSIDGKGTAGTPVGGVLSVQGVSGGTAVPVSGAVTATVADQSGTDITTPSPTMPAGGAGTRGWLSAIWTYINSMLGTDITTPTTMPTGGVGLRGWISAIWTKLNGSVAVTGTFYQTTQPTSISSAQVASGAVAAGAVATGAIVDLGTTITDAAATNAVEDTTAKTGIGLWKGIKNLLKLINDKMVTGTIIGDVNVRAITAGETHLGEVGGKGIPVTVNFTRPADTTAYSQYDNVGVNLAVSGATHATPIVITTPTHGLADGDYVTIAGVGVNTAANGNFYVKVTGYTTLTFALYSDKALTTPVAGNGDYSTGGTVARLFRIPGFFRKAGGSGYITKISCTTNNAAWATQHQLWFYNAPATAILDNIEKTALWANTAQRMGPITMPAFSKPSTNSDCAISLSVPGDGVSSLPLGVNNGETPVDLDLYFMVSLPLATPGTPTSAQQFTYKFFDDAH